MQNHTTTIGDAHKLQLSNFKTALTEIAELKGGIYDLTVIPKPKSCTVDVKVDYTDVDDLTAFIEALNDYVGDEPQKGRNTAFRLGDDDLTIVKNFNAGYTAVIPVETVVFT